MKTLTAIPRFMLSLVFCCAVAWAQDKGYTIQVASVPTEAEAQTVVKGIRARGLEAYWVRAQVPGKGTRYRVRIGRFPTKAQAQHQGEVALRQQLIQEFLVADYDAPKGGTPTRAKVAPPPAKPLPAEQPPKTTVAEAASSPRLEEPAAKAATNAQGEAGAKAEMKADAKMIEPEKPAPTAPTSGRSRWALKSQHAAPESQTAAPPQKEVVRTASNLTPASLETEAPPAGREPKPNPDKSSAPSSAADHPPRIAQPPVADAITDVAIENTKWQVVRQSTPTDKNLRAIYFVDSLTGWAAGDAGAVYRTTDGGRTWKPLLGAASDNISRLQFVDWNTGWMIGEAYGKEGAEPQTVLLSTTNSGRTWQKKALANVLSFYFVDDKRGWAVGKNATLLKTTDGGGEWKRYAGIEKLIGQPVESSAYNFGFADVHFIDAAHGWVVGNFYGRARDHIGGLFMTVDGGATWKRVPLALQSQHTTGRSVPGLLHSVSFTDASTGSVTGEMYDGEGRFFFVAHTKDGGKTWQQYRTPSRATHSTQFLDPTHGWTAAAAPREGAADAVVYDTTVMRTENGGVSWRNDFVARGSQIRGVFFLSPGKGWAVGDRGMILRYEDHSKAQGLGAKN